MHLLWIKFKKARPLFNNLLDHWVDSAHLAALLTKCFTVLIFLTLTLRNLKILLQAKIKVFYSLPLLLQVEFQVLIFWLKVLILQSLLKLILSKWLSFVNLTISILNSQALKNSQKKWLFKIDLLFNTRELCVFKNQVINKLLLVSSFSHTLDSQLSAVELWLIVLIPFCVIVLIYFNFNSSQSLIYSKPHIKCIPF